MERSYNTTFIYVFTVSDPKNMLRPYSLAFLNFEWYNIDRGYGEKFCMGCKNGPLAVTQSDDPVTFSFSITRATGLEHDKLISCICGGIVSTTDGPRLIGATFGIKSGG